MEGGYESGEHSRRKEHHEYEESEENRRREAKEIFEKAMEDIERKERAERTFNEAMEEIRRKEAEEIFNEAMDEVRRKEAEDVTNEALEDLERYERAQAEAMRYSENWSEIVEEKLKEIEKKAELQKEKRWAERFRQETEADEVADDEENWHNWPTPKREYEVWIGDVTDEGKSHETEEADETVKSAVKELDDSAGDNEATEAQNEGQEHTGVERPQGWDPTTDDWDDYEKAVAKAFEGAGATEEEMKERWREQYVQEMQNIIEKEPQIEKSSLDSVEGKESSEEGELGTDDKQSDEYVQSGDGTVTSVVTEQLSEEANATNETSRMNPETSSEQVETELLDSESKVDEVKSEESEAIEGKEETVEHEYEEATREKTRVRNPQSKPGDFMENRESQIEHTEKRPARKTSNQEVYKDNMEDASSGKADYESASEQKVDSREVSQQNEEGDDDSEITHETDTSEDHLENEMEEDEVEVEEDQEPSSKEMNQDNAEDIPSNDSESETMPEGYAISTQELQKDRVENVEAEIESKEESSDNKSTNEQTTKRNINEAQDDGIEKLGGYSESDEIEPHHQDNTEHKGVTSNTDSSGDKEDSVYDDSDIERGVIESKVEPEHTEENEIEEVQDDKKHEYRQSELYEVDQPDKTREEEYYELEIDEELESKSKEDWSENHEQSEDVNDEEESYFPHLIPENAEERRRRMLRELFESLPEEIKELYRQLAMKELLTKKDLQRLIERYPEVYEKEDYDEQLEECLDFLKFLEFTNELDELNAEELANELEMDIEQINRYIKDGFLPPLMRFLKSLEMERLWTDDVTHLIENDLPKTREDADKLLEQSPELRNHPFFSQLYHELIAWLEVIAAKDRDEIPFIIYNGTKLYEKKKVREMSKELGVKDNDIFSWLRGETRPQLLDILSEKTRTDSERQERLEKKNSYAVYKVNVSIPYVKGVRIKSFKQLKHIVHQDYPGLLDREDLPTLLKGAAVHLEILCRFSKKKYVSSEQVHLIAEHTGFSYGAIRKWLSKGLLPYIYHLLDKSMSYQDAKTKKNSLLRKLNGITDLKKLDRRLGWLFIQQEVKNSLDYKKERTLAIQFFRFIGALLPGGSMLDIARRSKLKKQDITHRLHEEILPKLINTGTMVPSQQPTRGKRWLPLKSGPGRYLEKFIQVPMKIKSPKDILDVLEQVQSLDNSKMDEYEREFGTLSKTHALMYVLGVIVSDASFNDRTAPSTYVSFTASKKYSWSKNFGRGFCYALGTIGIPSTRQKNITILQENGTKVEKRVWTSSSTPFFVWIRKTLLGLNTKKPKSYTPINADWIFNMPDSWRIALLQGIADGDGSASVRLQQAQITSTINQDFIKRLLASLNIQVSVNDKNIIIQRRNDIMRAEKLPLFRHATGRQYRLTETIAMLNSIVSQKRRRFSQEELELIKELNESGHSCGEIAATLWAEYGIFRRSASIYQLIKRIYGGLT